MSSNLTPLEVCERLIGTVEDVARAAGLGAKAGYGWRRASEWREAGDVPSARVMRQLLSHARLHGIPLTPEHLIFGASEAELAALMPEKVAA